MFRRPAKVNSRALMQHSYYLLLLVLVFAGQAFADMQLDIQRQSELLNLLKQDCGACHGTKLKGGLGPPLTVKALRQKDSTYLATTILYGRPGTAMPPWQDFLTVSEAKWLVQNLRTGNLKLKKRRR